MYVAILLGLVAVGIIFFIIIVKNNSNWIKSRQSKVNFKVDKIRRLKYSGIFALAFVLIYLVNKWSFLGGGHDISTINTNSIFDIIDRLLIFFLFIAISIFPLLNDMYPWIFVICGAIFWGLIGMLFGYLFCKISRIDKKLE